MRTILKGVIFGIAVLFLCAGMAQAAFRFGVAAEPYPPFSSKNAAGQWNGWEIDAMNAVCSHLDEKCELVEVAWDGIIPALLARHIDVIWSSMAITEERKKTIDFTDMYYNSQVIMIGAKNGNMDISSQALKGKVIGVQAATIHEKYVQKYFGTASAIKVYQTQDEANSDIAAGRLDYVQGNASTLYTVLETESGRACCEAKGQVPSDPEILGQGVGAGVRKDDTALREKITTAIKAASAAGDFVRITSKYPELEKLIVLPQ